MIKITRLALKNYRGIKSLDAKVTRGVIARGRNGSGKTSVLNALGAALAASDIGPDAVRLGELDGEILVDLDVAGGALHVRRRFGVSGSALTITNDDGDKKAKPTAYLADLLGSSPLDVIDVVLEKDKKKRRERILAALPVRVTVEQLRRWVPALPETYDTSGHGLEVIERLRAAAYEKRTAANKVEKTAADDLARAQAAAKAARELVPDGAGVHDAALSAEVDAGVKLETLRLKKAQAAKATERMAGLRANAEQLRADAKAAEEEAGARPTDAEIDAVRTEIATSGAAIREIERKLTEAREAHDVLLRKVDSFNAQTKKCDAAAKRASELAAQAAKVEEGLAAAVETITDEEIAEAEKVHDIARVALEAAAKRREAEAAENVAEDSKKAHAIVDAEAKRLDGVVRALTTDAPAAILAETENVAAGLELDGDEVRLNGVSLDRLCGAEQMKFAADIARALHPNVGFLVVDGMERLDPDQLDAFVAAATAGGRQLFGSLVDRGDLVLAAVEHDAGPAIAAE